MRGRPPGYAVNLMSAGGLNRLLRALATTTLTGRMR